MLEFCKRPLEACFGGGGDDGLLWHTNLKTHALGDYSIAIVQANSTLEDQSQVLTSPSATYIGIYDGHGGPETSRFIADNLFPFLQKFASEEGGLSEAVIKKAFNETEEQFLQFVKQSLTSRPQIASVGSCCLVGAISNNILYVANLGDSRVVLGKKVDCSVVAERLSTDHNVGVEEIRNEVMALHPDDAHIVVYTHGVWRIKGIIQHNRCLWKVNPPELHVNQLLEIILARTEDLTSFCILVSRSIGDVFLKKPEFNRDPLFQQFGYLFPLKRPVMTAEPSVLSRTLTPEDMFLIFASDGLWEHLTDEAAVDIILKNPRPGIAKRLVRAALEEAARKKEMRYKDLIRVEKGERRHIHDDITVIVVYLDQYSHDSLIGSKRHGVYGCTDAPVDIFSLNNRDKDDL